MPDPDKAMQTQLTNLEQRSGKTLAQLHAVLKQSKLDKHGAMVTLLKQELGMGHGDANLVVHLFRQQGEPAGAKPAGDPLDAIYTGAKAPLREVHEALLARITKFGPFEQAPKKAYVSLRRKKQFAMVGPGTKGRLQVGLNLRDVEPTERLVAMPAGGMCQFSVHLTSVKEVDAELLRWLRLAFDAAG